MEETVSEASHLAEALEGLLASPDHSWFVTYPAAIDRLTSGQAARAPGPRFNSVWGVTRHLTVCQQFALAVLRGDTLDLDTFFADGVWPPVRDPQVEGSWQKAKADLLAANHALAEFVAGLSAAALELELPYVGMKGYQYVQGHLAHNSNHLCEIVSIRHMQGLWLDKT
jgi:hypothetical protein